MMSDPELDAWRSDWQSTDTVPPELRRRVEREIRTARRAWWAPVAVTVLMGGGTIAWAVVSGERTAVQVATTTWVFIAVTWITSLELLRRTGGRRRPDAATTTVFLDFTVRVCRGTRAGIAAAAVLYSLFLGYMLFWRYQTGSFANVGEYLLSGRVVAMAIVSVVLAIAAWHRYRRLGAELQSLVAAQRQFGPDAPVDQPGADVGE